MTWSSSNHWHPPTSTEHVHQKMMKHGPYIKLKAYSNLMSWLVMTSCSRLPQAPSRLPAASHRLSALCCPLHWRNRSISPWSARIGICGKMLPGMNPTSLGHLCHVPRPNNRGYTWALSWCLDIFLHCDSLNFLAQLLISISWPPSQQLRNNTSNWTKIKIPGCGKVINRGHEE